MNKSYVIGIVVLLIVILGGWYWSSHSQSAAPLAATTPTAPETPVTQPTTTANTPDAPMTATITYTANGFSPDPVTIKQGGTVTFVDKSSGTGMWVASNAHPSHMQYSGTTRAQHCPDTTGTAFDQCATGASYSFTFQKVGSWNYHNHVNADDGGTITVVP